MIFEHWLKKQKDRDDVIGDLAKDYIDGMAFQKKSGKKVITNVEKQMIHFSACADAWNSLREAKEEFTQLSPL